MAKRKSFEEKNNYIHPTRKKIIDVAFGREDNNQRVHGYESEETKRQIGEVWTDVNGVTWEQKDGYKSSVTKMDDVRQYLNKLSTCSIEECQTVSYSKIDKKLIRKTGKCLDCLQKYEFQLKKDGTYAYYEDYKITCNMLSHATDNKIKYETALDDITNKVSFVNETGEIENWKWDIDIEKVKEDLKKDIEDISLVIEGLTERKVALEEKLVELNHPEIIIK